MATMEPLRIDNGITTLRATLGHRLVLQQTWQRLSQVSVVSSPCQVMETVSNLFLAVFALLEVKLTSK